VIYTRVGYAGGTKKDPTYESLGDHSETIEVAYDPRIISYAELLDIFWQSHEPTVQSSSRQYMSIIFYHDEEQRKLAVMTKGRQEASRKRKIQTIIVPAGLFYPAEDYHQKYYLRSTPSVMKEFNALYPSSTDFINSTVAAKVNGFLGGNGTIGDLKADLESIKLAHEAIDRIIKGLRGTRG
jgi:peptide-methionine (S)-S-oxide reductase